MIPESLKLVVFSILICIVSAGCVQHKSVTKEETETKVEMSIETKEKAVTLEDYKRAEKFLGRHTSDKVFGEVSGQSWSPGDLLIYNTRTREGTKYILADPATGDKREAFDHQGLADTLSKKTNREVKAADLPIKILIC